MYVCVHSSAHLIVSGYIDIYINMYVWMYVCMCILLYMLACLLLCMYNQTYFYARRTAILPRHVLFLVQFGFPRPASVSACTHISYKAQFSIALTDEDVPVVKTGVCLVAVTCSLSVLCKKEVMLMTYWEMVIPTSVYGGNQLITKVTSVTNNAVSIGGGSSLPAREGSNV